MRKPLTRAQREALKRVYDRGPLYNLPVDDRHDIARYVHRGPEQVNATGIAASPLGHGSRDGFVNPLTYRQFRRNVYRPGYDNCIMVPWLGVWLGIERDGYTHS
jgi:hypothetical protein